MLASIHPLGERGRGQRYATTASSYVLGAAAGGALMGAVLGFLGSLAASLGDPSNTLIAWLVVAAASGALILEHRARNSHLLSWHRQVNEDWMTTYRGWVYGAGFGFQLGLGFATIITSGTVYLTFAMAFLTGSWPWGLAVGLVFRLTRASVALSVARINHPHQLRSAHRQLQRLAAPAQRVARGAQAAVGVVGGLAVMM
jgi:hypothetical protein